jgi:hypothetical protein
MINGQTDIVENTKAIILASIDRGIESIVEKLSSDILNLELAILHQYKIYDEQAQNVQKIFDHLDGNIDYVFSEHCKTLQSAIGNLLDELRDNGELLNLSGKIVRIK